MSSSSTPVFRASSTQTPVNPFASITETFFRKRTSEFNKTGLTDYGNELIYNYKYLSKAIELSANVLRNLPIVKHCIGPPFEHQEQLNKLLAQQKAATSYDEWFAVSLQLDAFLQRDVWKHTEESTLYDYKLLRKHLDQLRRARAAQDYATMVYLVRTTWMRNLGNMGNVNLYRHSHVGTKRLIEEYIEECENVLAELVGVDCPLDDRYVLSMLLQTRKAIGRTALVLSGGGCFGLFHIGVLSNLLELGLLPRIISGSSAGAIIASILCVQSQEETLELISTIETRRFDIFEETAHKEPFLVNMARFLKYGTWFDNKYLQQTMFEFLGDLTFRESYNRTGRILNITVSPASIHEQPTLLNYLTAPNVLIWSAVCASCSLPGVFPSSTIYEKTTEGLRQEWNHASVKFVDGSVDNDLPIARLSEMFNVDHIIACQCNPHVVPFLKMSVACVGGEVENEYSAKFKTVLNKCYDLFSAELMHYLEVASELGVCRNIATKLRSVFAQQYSGDITILPDTRLTEIGRLLANPTPKFLLDATVRGARATWPKITVIKNHCSVEFALDKSISEIRSRLISTRLGSSLPLVMSPPQLPATVQSSIPDIDNVKVTMRASNQSVGNPSKSNNHTRHRSESLNIGSFSLHSSYYPPAPPAHVSMQQVPTRAVRYKNSMPLMYGSTSRMERASKPRRRRKTLSTLSNTDLRRSSYSGVPSQPPVQPAQLQVQQKQAQSYNSLPVSNNTTEPPSPFAIRKEFIARKPSNPTIAYNNNSSHVSPKMRKASKTIPKINSTFFKNNEIPKVLQNSPPVDPNDDDVIIRQITGAPARRQSSGSSKLRNDDDPDDDHDEEDDSYFGSSANVTSFGDTEDYTRAGARDEDDALADGYEHDSGRYTVSGAATPRRVFT